MNTTDFDYLIVGAGFAGLTAAERLCNVHGKKCLVVDKRSHLGGNAYDHYDDPEEWRSGYLSPAVLLQVGSTRTPRYVGAVVDPNQKRQDAITRGSETDLNALFLSRIGINFQNDRLVLRSVRRRKACRSFGRATARPQGEWP